MSQINHQVRLAARPTGLPQASDWDIVEEPAPTPGAGEFVVAISTSRSTRRCAAG